MKKITKSDITAITVMKQEGATLKEIANEFDISTSYVHKILNERGDKPEQVGAIAPSEPKPIEPKEKTSNSDVELQRLKMEHEREMLKIEKDFELQKMRYENERMETQQIIEEDEPEHDYYEEEEEEYEDDLAWLVEEEEEELSEEEKNQPDEIRQREKELLKNFQTVIQEYVDFAESGKKAHTSGIWAKFYNNYRAAAEPINELITEFYGEEGKERCDFERIADGFIEGVERGYKKGIWAYKKAVWNDDIEFYVNEIINAEEILEYQFPEMEEEYED